MSRATWPRNVPVRIAVDADVTDGDLFDEQFDGIGVMIRRSDRDWAYANLATLEPKHDPNPIWPT